MQASNATKWYINNKPDKEKLRRAMKQEIRNKSLVSMAKDLLCSYSNNLPGDFRKIEGLDA